MDTGFNGNVTSDRLPCYTLYLQRAVYDVKTGDVQGYVSISNDSNTNNYSNVIDTFGWSGAKEYNDANWSATLNCAVGTNCTGNIYLSFVGATGNSAYSLLLDFRKEPTHFDQGQTRDPISFNRYNAQGGAGS